MKLELPKRKPKAEAGSKASSKIQAPAFAQDLYKDMRDRRLIIPAVALLIAIVAVPFVLSSPSESAVSVPSPVSDPEAVAVEPAVLAVQEVGVRDFRERLDKLNRKNPFGSRFEPKTTGVEGVGELEEPVDTGQGGGSGTTPVDTGDTPTDTSPSTSASEPPASVDPPEPFVLVPRVDVEVGIVDRDRRQTLENVKYGDLLPSKKTPTAMYAGNAHDSSVAGFIVSRDVSNVNGDGECRPHNGGPCQFLRLGDGDSAYLRFDDDHRYVITVKDIYFVRASEDEVKGGG